MSRVNTKHDIRVWLPSQAREKLNHYMEVMELQNPSDAVKDLVLIALDSLPEDGVLVAVRTREFNKVRHAFFKEANAFCKDYAERLALAADDPKLTPEDL